MKHWLLTVLAVLVFAVAACGGDDDESPSRTASPTATAGATPTRSPAATQSPVPGDTGAPTATLPLAPRLEPTGFPIDPQTRLGVVTGDVGSRQLLFDGSGPAAFEYALNSQPFGDLDEANRSGWNCRTHFEYEGIAAEDFYIPAGTPILATMDGAATLYVISYVNDFDRYGVDREPYLGNPDRSRAPISPFPAQSGGLGVYVVIVNDGFVTESGHLDLGLTVGALPEGAFIPGYDRDTDYDSQFAEVPQPRIPAPIAAWDVSAGDVIGLSGDAGYSEGPHVHYTVARRDGPRLCPTNESSFDDGGWLFR